MLRHLSQEIIPIPILLLPFLTSREVDDLGCNKAAGSLSSLEVVWRDGQKQASRRAFLSDASSSQRLKLLHKAQDQDLADRRRDC